MSTVLSPPASAPEFDPGPAGVEQDTSRLQKLRNAAHGLVAAIVEVPSSIGGSVVESAHTTTEGVASTVESGLNAVDASRASRITEKIPDLEKEVIQTKGDIRFHRTTARDSAAKRDPSTTLTSNPENPGRPGNRRAKEVEQRKKEAAKTQYHSLEKWNSHVTKRGRYRSGKPKPTPPGARNHEQVKASRRYNRTVHSRNVYKVEADNYTNPGDGLYRDIFISEERDPVTHKSVDRIRTTDEVMQILDSRRITSAQRRAILKAHKLVVHANHEAHEKEHELTNTAHGRSDDVRKLNAKIKKIRSTIKRPAKLEGRIVEREQSITSRAANRTNRREKRREAKILRQQQRYGAHRAAELDRILDRRTEAARAEATSRHSQILAVSDSYDHGTLIDFGDRDSKGKPVLRPATAHDLQSTLLGIKDYLQRIDSIAPTNSEAMAGDLLDTIINIPFSDPSTGNVTTSPHSIRDIIASGIV